MILFRLQQHKSNLNQLTGINKSEDLDIVHYPGGSKSNNYMYNLHNYSVFYAL